MMRKIKFCLESIDIPLASPLAKTIPHATTKIIMARIAVAKSELTPLIPILAIRNKVCVPLSEIQATDFDFYSFAIYTTFTV